MRRFLEWILTESSDRHLDGEWLVLADMIEDQKNDLIMQTLYDLLRAESDFGYKSLSKIKNPQIVTDEEIMATGLVPQWLPAWGPEEPNWTPRMIARVRDDMSGHVSMPSTFPYMNVVRHAENGSQETWKILRKVNDRHPSDQTQTIAHNIDGLVRMGKVLGNMMTDEGNFSRFLLEYLRLMNMCFSWQIPFIVRESSWQFVGNMANRIGSFEGRFSKNHDWSPFQRTNKIDYDKIRKKK